MDSSISILLGKNHWSSESGAAFRFSRGASPPTAVRRAALVTALGSDAGAAAETGEGLGEAVLALALWLHERSGQGKTTGRLDRDRNVAVLDSREPRFAAECLRRAHEWLTANEEEDLSALATRLNTLRDDECLGPSTLSIVTAAERRGIPSLRLSPVDSLVQLGWGAKGRRIWAAETEASRAIPNEIAQDKDLTRRLLRAVGIPVAEGVAVGSRNDAWATARLIGLPVVVKPQTGSKGRGVSIGLTSEATVLAAYDVAASFGQGVVVEKFVRGTHHRVLVVGGRAIAASRASEEVVFGDGVSSITALVERANADPQRSFGHASVFTRLELDAIALELLERRGLTPSSVPGPGEKVFIHLNGDLTTDVTDEMHPEVARVCVDAAFAIGLSVTGVDLLLDDISRPLDAQGGVVVELNARPGLLAHLQPVEGTPRDVGAAILETLFAPEEDGRIPVIVVTGDEARREMAKVLRYLLLHEFASSGAATGAGLFVGDRRLSEEPSDDAEGLRRLLTHRGVDVILSERSPQTLLHEGLAIDRAEVVVLAKSGADTRLMSAFAIEDARHVVVSTDFNGELGAGTRRAIFGSVSHPAIQTASDRGERVAYFDETSLVFREREEVMRVSLSSLPLALGSPEDFCAAGLALWALGHPPSRVFERSWDLGQGRG